MFIFASNGQSCHGFGVSVRLLLAVGSPEIVLAAPHSVKISFNKILVFCFQTVVKFYEVLFYWRLH